MNQPVDSRPPAAATVLALLALGVLAVVAVLGGITVLASAPALAHQYPEYATLQIPLTCAALGLIVCVEVAIAIIASLVCAVRNGRILDDGSPKLVNALIVTFVVAAAFCVAGWVFIPGPPPLGLVAVGAAFAALSVVSVLIVLRSLLRQALSMRMVLDAVT